MNPILTKCPVCSGDLVVTRLHCPACETSIEGSFDPGMPGSRLQEAFSPEQLKPLLPFSRLAAEQLQFVLTFVRCEGRFNRMEDEMGLSYPTLRNRLNEIIRAMGYEPSREEARYDAAAAAALRESAARMDTAGRNEPGAQGSLPGPVERQGILDMLSRGEIDLEEAKRRLRGERAAPAATAAPATPIAPATPVAPASPDAPAPVAPATPVAPAANEDPAANSEE